ncbi:hypothetical protein D3C81_1685980 [compost metagenome]
MGACIAPVPVQPVLGQGGLAAGQFEQSATRGQGNLGADRAHFGHGDGGGCHCVGVGLRLCPVKEFACAFKQGFSGMQANGELADGLE